MVVALLQMRESNERFNPSNDKNCWDVCFVCVGFDDVHFWKSCCWKIELSWVNEMGEGLFLRSMFVGWLKWDEKEREKWQRLKAQKLKMFLMNEVLIAKEKKNEWMNGGWLMMKMSLLNLIRGVLKLVVWKI